MEKPGFYVFYTTVTRGEKNARPKSYCRVYIVFDRIKSVDENVRLILANQHFCFSR